MNLETQIHHAIHTSLLRGIPRFLVMSKQFALRFKQEFPPFRTIVFNGGDVCYTVTLGLDVGGYEKKINLAMVVLEDVNFDFRIATDVGSALTYEKQEGAFPWKNPKPTPNLSKEPAPSLPMSTLDFPLT